jgi:hypothetical protein
MNITQSKSSALARFKGEKMKLKTLRRCGCGRYMNQLMGVSAGTTCLKEYWYPAPYPIRLIDPDRRLRPMMKSLRAPGAACDSLGEGLGERFLQHWWSCFLSYWGSARDGSNSSTSIACSDPAHSAWPQGHGSRGRSARLAQIASQKGSSLSTRQRHEG